MDIGDWLMRAIAHFHVECATRDIPPCIHVETLQMPRKEFVAFVVSAYLDELGIVHS